MASKLQQYYTVILVHTWLLLHSIKQQPGLTMGPASWSQLNTVHLQTRARQLTRRRAWARESTQKRNIVPLNCPQIEGQKPRENIDTAACVGGGAARRSERVSTSFTQSSPSSSLRSSHLAAAALATAGIHHLYWSAIQSPSAHSIWFRFPGTVAAASRQEGI